MPYCPKCQHQIVEGARFCNHCGTQIPEAPRQNVCSKCGQVIQPNAAFCNTCGTPVSAAQPRPTAPTDGQPTPQTPQKPLIDTAELSQKATEAAKKVAAGTKKLAGIAMTYIRKVPKKFLIIGAAALVAIIILIIVLSAIAGAGARDNYALYMKNGELMFNSLTGDGAVQVTDRLVYPSDATSVGYVTTMSSDGKYLFYPDRGDWSSDSFTLYYRNIRKNGAEATKIDSDIHTYSVNEKANLVTYLKDDTLYQHDLKEKEKVASNVEEFYVSGDGKKIIFLDDEGKLYAYTSGKDKEKIASDVSNIYYCSEDLGTVAYTEEDTLYIYKGKGEPEKVESHVYNAMGFTDAGTCYFAVKVEEPLYLNQFIDDDLATSDAAMEEPAWEASSEDWDAWYAKGNRDSIRQSASEYVVAESSCALYYYNGKEAVEVHKDCNNILTSGTGVVAFTAYGDISTVSLPISAYTTALEMAEAVYEERNEGSKIYIANGADLTELNIENVKTMGFSEDGKNAYILADYDEEDYEGTLYKMAMGKEPQEFDTDVYYVDYFYNAIEFLNNGKLLYFKDVRDSEGDLCVEGDTVASDVYCHSLISNPEEKATFLFYTDYSFSRYEGTLNIYKNGKIIKVADDVNDARILPNNDVLYLGDYSSGSGEGDLYQFTGKKATLIDEDVEGIVPMFGWRTHAIW